MMENSITIICDESKIRIDKYIKVDGLTRSMVQNLINSGDILVNNNNVKVNHNLNVGDEITINIPEPESAEIVPEDIPLDIVYEDDQLLVINKPQGMVVHPAAGNYSGTLVNALMYHCGDNLSGINGVIRPGIVHRIDKDTSGLLLVAKTNLSHLSLSEQIKEKTVKRSYRAICHGVLRSDRGKIDAPIGRHQTERKKMTVTNKNSKEAVTHFEVLERFHDYTFIKCVLETGRTHQIRVHMKYMGHPILGDEVYGPKSNEFKIKGQVLHAAEIGFIHPVTKEYMEFSADIPDNFKTVLENLRGRVE